MNVCQERKFLELLTQPNLGGILEARPHHIALMTYNDVRGAEEGEVDSGKPDVRITVSTGGLYRNESFNFGMMLGTAAVQSDNMDLGRMSLELCHGVADELQEDVASRGRRMIGQVEQCNLTVFLYAGLSARGGALKTLMDIKRDFPHARCHVVTCDCNNPTQFSDFANLIDTLIICGWCGGRDFLGKVVKAAQAA